MSQDGPSFARVGELFAQRTSGFLTSTTALPETTCAICRAPVAGYTLCYPCDQHQQSGLPRADQTGFMIYAQSNAQSGHMMESYKGRKGVAVSQDSRRYALFLLYLALHHRPCATRLADGLEITHWAIVPSSTPSPDEPIHPMQQLAQSSGQLTDIPQATITVNDASTPRALTETAYAAAGLPPQAHVLLLEDTWVSGGHLQSAANALKRAGAQHVSALVLARWLEPTYEATRRFLADPNIVRTLRVTDCPWTAGPCP